MLHFAANSRVFPVSLGMDVVCLKALLRATALLQQFHAPLCYQTYWIPGRVETRDPRQFNVLSQELSKTLPDSGLLKSKHRKRGSQFARGWGMIGWKERIWDSRGKNRKEWRKYILIKTASYKILKGKYCFKKEKTKELKVWYVEKRGWRRWIWEEFRRSEYDQITLYEILKE